MICKRCKVDKSLNCKGRCAECQEYLDKYYRENREKSIARAQKSLKKKGRAKINSYRKEQNRKNPLAIMLQGARQRAKEKDIPFDITIDDLEVPKVCPVLGIEMCVNEGHAKDNSMSLDRIVPELGYVRGNVAVISYKANTIKNNATLEDLEKVIEWLRKMATSSQDL